MKSTRLLHGLGTLVVMLALGCGGAFRTAIKSGDSFAAQGQWDQAAEQYEQAVQLNPDDVVAQQKLKDARHHQSIIRTAKARESVRHGDTAGALQLLEEAVRFDASNTEAKSLLIDVTRQALDKAEQLSSADDDLKALELVTLVLEGEPTNDRAKALDSRVRDKLAGQSYSRAEEFSKAGKHGNAMVEFAAAQTYVPNYRDSVARMTQERQTLKSSLNYYVVLGRLVGDPKARDIAEVAANSLSESLGDSPLKIVKQVPPGLPQDQPVIQLRGAFEGYRYAHNQSVTNRSCTFVCGTTAVANSDHQTLSKNVAEWGVELRAAGAEVTRLQPIVANLQRLVDDRQRDVDRQQIELDRAKLDQERCQAQPGNLCTAEQQRVEQALKALGAAQARLAEPQQQFNDANTQLAAAQTRRDEAANQVNAQQTQLNATPSTVSVERQCTHSYAVTLHRVNGTINLKVNAENVRDRAKVIDGQVLSYNVDKQDESFPAAPGRCQEVAAGDPADVPSESDVRKDLASQAAGGLRQTIIGVYGRQRQGYLSGARTQESSGLRDDAVESYIRYLVSSPDLKNDAESESVIRSVAGAKGLAPETVRQAL